LRILTSVASLRNKPGGYTGLSYREIHALDRVARSSLELDVTVPTGQYKTRVEAFLEVLDLEGE